MFLPFFFTLKISSLFRVFRCQNVGLGVKIFLRFIGINSSFIWFDLDLILSGWWTENFKFLKYFVKIKKWQVPQLFWGGKPEVAELVITNNKLSFLKYALNIIHRYTKFTRFWIYWNQSRKEDVNIKQRYYNIQHLLISFAFANSIYIYMWLLSFCMEVIKIMLAWYWHYELIWINLVLYTNCSVVWPKEAHFGGGSSTVIPLYMRYYIPVLITLNEIPCIYKCFFIFI